MSFDIRKGEKATPVGKSGMMSRRKANFCLAGVGAVANGQVIEGEDYGYFLHANNLIIQVKKPSLSQFLTSYKFVSMEDDWLVCHTWDGATEGTDDILIAKPDSLRFSISSEVIDGVTVNYSSYDTSAQTRHASDGTNDEDQVIVPRYLSGQVIRVMAAHTFVVDADGVDLGLIDTNNAARAWSEIPI